MVKQLRTVKPGWWHTTMTISSFLVSVSPTYLRKLMDIIAVEPHVDCKCKICNEYGTLKKNIGKYCYDCLRKYKIEYPEYIKSEQYYMFMKLTLENSFDKPNKT